MPQQRELDDGDFVFVLDLPKYHRGRILAALGRLGVRTVGQARQVRAFQYLRLPNAGPRSWRVLRQALGGFHDPGAIQGAR